MSGVYKKFPNGKGVLVQRLLVRAGCMLFGGDNPIDDIKTNIVGIPSEWSNSPPGELDSWRSSIRAGLDKIIKGAPDLSVRT